MTLFDPNSTQDQQPQKQPWGFRQVIGWLVVLVFSAGFLLAVYTPAPYVIERPGPAFNVLGQDSGSPVITVTGAKTYDTCLLYTSDAADE